MLTNIVNVIVSIVILRSFEPMCYIIKRFLRFNSINVLASFVNSQIYCGCIIYFHILKSFVTTFFLRQTKTGNSYFSGDRLKSLTSKEITSKSYTYYYPTSCPGSGWFFLLNLMHSYRRRSTFSFPSLYTYVLYTAGNQTL